MKFSVVVITKDEGPRLRLCLASVSSAVMNLPQGMYEVIVVNDGSRDDTVRIVERYSQQLPIVSIFHPESMGRSASRNAGAIASSGEIIFFLDGDTLVSSQCLQHHLQFHETSGERDVARGEMLHFRHTRFMKDPCSGELYREYSDRSVDPGDLITEDIVRLNFDALVARASPGIYPGSVPRRLAELELEALRDGAMRHSLWMAMSAQNFSLKREFFSKSGGFCEALSMNEHRDFALSLFEASGACLRLVEDASCFHVCHSTHWRDPIKTLWEWEPIFLARHSSVEGRLLPFFWLTLAEHPELPEELRIHSIGELIQFATGDVSRFEEFRRTGNVFHPHRNLSADLSNAYVPKYPSSTISSLIDECLHMGWPTDPDRGRLHVMEYLRRLGFSVDEPTTEVDLYEALNFVRTEGWKNESELWSRYATIRRAEVDRMLQARSVKVVLQRTIMRTSGEGIARIRLPLPIAHSCQSNLRWRVGSVTDEIVKTTERPGVLDIQVTGRQASATAEITYEASLAPQTRDSELCDGGDRGPSPAVPSLFKYPAVLRQGLANINRNESPESRLRSLWRLFHKSLRSGHLHHGEWLISGLQGSEIDSLWFDCVVGSWNFARACQELGLRARVLSGILIQRFGPSPHFWCEVLLEGRWCPVDLYSWDLSSANEDAWDALFMRLDSRMRFERFPEIFSRFLPNVPWFVERRSGGVSATYTYRDRDSGRVLAEDRWTSVMV